MKRLTKSELVNGIPVWYPQNRSGLGELVLKSNPYREICEKLKAYEDLEEQGKLLRLPCKVGDTVYPIMVVGAEFGNLKYEIYEAKVRRFHIDSIHLCVEITIAETAQIIELVAETFGETFFLTREEAETALERMKGEEHE